MKLLADRSELKKGLLNLIDKVKDFKYKKAAAIGIGTAITITGCVGVANKFFKEKKYIVTHQYTNKYTEIPDDNKEHSAMEGEILEYNMDSAQYRNPIETENDEIEWIAVNEGENIYKAKWIELDYDNDNNSEYIPAAYVDEYKPHRAKNKSCNIRKTPEINGDDNILSKMVENDICYVDTSCRYKMIDGQPMKVNIDDVEPDEHQWCKAIVKKINENDEKYYEYGYVDSNVITELDSKNVVGLVNTNTFFREYPLVTELQGSIIDDRATNGTILNVVDIVKQNDETWVKCKGKNGKYFYVAEYAVKDINSFDKKVIVKNDGTKFGRDNITCLKGTELMIDTTSKYSNDMYMVYSPNYARTGYVKGEDVLYESGEPFYSVVESQNSDWETQTSIIDNVENQETNIEKPTTETNLNEHNNNENVENNITEQAINECSNNVANIESGASIGIDLSAYTDVKKFKQAIRELKCNNNLSTVILRVGVTGQFNTFGLQYFEDSKEIMAKYNGGEPVECLQKYYDEIKKKVDDPLVYKHRGVGYNSAGPIEDFKDYVEAVIDEGLTVGVYYYSCAINPDEAYAEAADIYAKMHVLEELLGDKYKNAKKIPMVIDIETAGEFRNKKGIMNCGEGDLNCREQAIIELVKILGKGTDRKGAWTVGDVDPKNGYGIYDDRFVMYGDVNIIYNYLDLNKIERELPNYHMFRWMTRDLTSINGINNHIDSSNGDRLTNAKKVSEYILKNPHLMGTRR